MSKKKKDTINTVEKSSENKVIDLLERSEILDVNNYLIHNWNLDISNENSSKYECDDVVLSFSYSDDEGYEYEFGFTKQAICEASVIENSISMVDDTGELVDISCYKLEKV